MQLALHTLMWHAEPLEAVIGHARELGVPNLDLGALPGCGHLPLAAGEAPDAACVAVREALPPDVRVLAVTADHPGLSAPDAAGRAAGVGYTVAALRAAALLGAPVVGTSLGNVGADRAWSEAADCAVASLSQVMRLAPAGVRVAVEVHVNDVCNSLETAEAILDAVADDRLGVAFDTSLLFHNRIDVDEAFDRLGARVFHVHLRGATHDTYFAIPGRDEMDFARFFRRLKECGYQGGLSLELYEVEKRYGTTTLEAARESLEYLRGVLQAT